MFADAMNAANSRVDRAQRSLTRGSAVPVPVPQRGLRVDRGAVPAKLEVEVARGARGVAGPADAADRGARLDVLAFIQRARSDEVRVEVGLVRLLAVDEHEVPVHLGIVAGLRDLASAGND